MSLLVLTNRSKFPLRDLEGDYVLIPLTKGLVAIIDKDDEFRISKYKWQACPSHGRYYAMRKTVSRNSTYWVRMHRQVMHTPNGKITHHKNRCTLDNRKKNLKNMTDLEHDLLHGRTIPDLENQAS